MPFRVDAAPLRQRRFQVCATISKHMKPPTGGDLKRQPTFSTRMAGVPREAEVAASNRALDATPTGAMRKELEERKRLSAGGA